MRSSSLCLFLVILCSAVALGCGSSSGSGTTSSGGTGGNASGTGGSGGGASSTGSGGTTGGTGGSAACVPAANIAGIVNKDHDPGPPPTMTGGTIADGTYVLTKMVDYNGMTGNTPHKETFVLVGGSGQNISSDQGTGPDVAIFFNYTTSGNKLTLDFTCGMTGSISMLYTATATELTTVNPDNPNELHTATKQ